MTTVLSSLSKRPLLIQLNLVWASLQEIQDKVSDPKIADEIDDTCVEVIQAIRMIQNDTGSCSLN